MSSPEEIFDRTKAELDSAVAAQQQHADDVGHWAARLANSRSLLHELVVTADARFIGLGLRLEPPKVAGSFISTTLVIDYTFIPANNFSGSIIVGFDHDGQFTHSAPNARISLRLASIPVDVPDIAESLAVILAAYADAVIRQARGL